MKTVLYGIVATVLSAVLTPVWAQTCGSQTPLPSDGSFSGDTSQSENETSIAHVCGGVDLMGAAAVLTWTYDGSASRNGTISVTPSGGSPNYDLALAVLRGSCSSSGTCVTVVDAHHDGTSAESINLAGPAFNTPGTYYLLVTSVGNGSTGNTSGAFSGTVGTLPVELQSFSIE